MTLLEKDTYVKAKDCHKQIITGKVANILEHTVIVKNGTHSYVISKKELKKQGYTFPRYKREKYFQSLSDKSAM